MRSPLTFTLIILTFLLTVMTRFTLLWLRFVLAVSKRRACKSVQFVKGIIRLKSVSVEDKWLKDSKQQIITELFPSQSKLFCWIPGPRWHCSVWGFRPSYTRGRTCGNTGSEMLTQGKCCVIFNCTWTHLSVCDGDILEPGCGLLWWLSRPGRRYCVFR